MHRYLYILWETFTLLVQSPKPCVLKLLSLFRFSLELSKMVISMMAYFRILRFISRDQKEYVLVEDAYVSFTNVVVCINPESIFMGPFCVPCSPISSLFFTSLRSLVYPSVLPRTITRIPVSPRGYKLLLNECSCADKPMFSTCVPDVLLFLGQKYFYTFCHRRFTDLDLSSTR